MRVHVLHDRRIIGTHSFGSSKMEGGSRGHEGCRTRVAMLHRTQSTRRNVLSLLIAASLAVAPAGAIAQPSSPAEQPPSEADRTGQVYHEGDSIPAGYRVERRVNRAPIIVGASLLGGGYLIAVMLELAISTTASITDSAGESGFKGQPAVFIPVVGSFIASSHNEGGVKAMEIGAGILQGVGAGLIFYGATSPKQTLVQDRSARPAPSLQVGPIVGAGRVGLQIGASF